MPSNPYVNCAKFETADRNDREQRDEAIARANERYAQKRKARLDRLTTDEVAIIEARERQLAAEAAKQSGAPVASEPDVERGEDPIPPRLQQPPPALPPGSQVSVDDKPKRGR